MLRKNHSLIPKVVAIVDRGGAVIDPSGVDYLTTSEVKHNSKTVSTHPRCGFPEVDAIKVIREVDCEVVVELTTSNLRDGEPGISNIIEALRAGKHVITANKGPLAIALPALMELASYNHVRLLFSGSVGGGTPFLSLIRRSLKGNEITGLRGILNGTTNFILSQMEKNDTTIQEVLKEAKRLGYSESDPTQDIEGFDSAAKLAILVNVAFGKKITISDVLTEGISGMDPKLVARAPEKAKAIRLVAEAGSEGISVRPKEISINDPICVYGPLNALCLTIEGNWQVTLVGKGAGGIETAQAVLRDLVELKEILSSGSSSFNLNV